MFRHLRSEGTGAYNQENTVNTYFSRFRGEYLALSLLAILGFTGFAYAQDSIIVPRTLDYGDIVEHPTESGKTIYAASRVPVNSDQIPQQIIIIEGEDIRRNGYATLVDVLKHVPGFRTSQPGSAFLGETFIMRGMVGNIYTKILINGIPIRSSATSGMAIGAQLPIRQAERIEIIFGPSAAAYGTDAMAGVINIVLPDVDRPVAVNATVGGGSGFATDVNLFMGGKAGKGENAIKYSLYGSLLRTADQVLKVENVITELDSDFVDSDDGIPLEDGAARISNIPHMSSQVGLSLDWRDFSVGLQSMYRRDHAALGSDPQEIGYGNPNTYFAEYVTSYKARYRRQFGKLFVNTNATLLRYRVDENSSYEGFDHPLSNDINFMYAKSTDLLVEQIFNVEFGKNLNLMVGGSFLNEYGIAFQGYMNRPIGDRDFERDTVMNSADSSSLIRRRSGLDDYEFRNLGAFSQLRYTSKRINASASIRLDRPSDEVIGPDSTEAIEWELSPSLGIWIELTRWLRFRGYAGGGFRKPGSFYTNNNYEAIIMDTLGPSSSLQRIKRPLKREELLGVEGGFEIDFNPALKGRIHYVHSFLENVVFGEIILDDDEFRVPIGEKAVLGYSNLDSESRLHSVQAGLSYKHRIFAFDLFGQRSWGMEEFADEITLESVRSVPNWWGQANFHFYPRHPKTGNELFRLSLYGQAFSKSIGVYVKAIPEVIETEVWAYHNIDLVLGREVVNRVYSYVRVNNITNNIGRGLYTNTFTGFYLPYVPQRGATISIGLNYTLK